MRYDTVMKARDFVKLLTENGWTLDRVNGSHHVYKHPTNPARISLPVHKGKDIPTGLLNSLLKTAGLK
jgi:predicted RNA binding protein YcfA (HicA-like mRNA interferase family)